MFLWGNVFVRDGYFVSSILSSVCYTVMVFSNSLLLTNQNPTLQSYDFS